MSLEFWRRKSAVFGGKNIRPRGSHVLALMDIRPRFSCLALPEGTRMPRPLGVSCECGTDFTEEVYDSWENSFLSQNSALSWESIDAVECLHIKWLEATKISTEFVGKIEISLHTSTHNDKAFYYYNRHSKMFFSPHCEHFQVFTSGAGLE